MGLFSSLGSLFGGGGAAEDIAHQERQIIGRVEDQQGRQEAVNQPFLGGGTRAFNALSDFALTSPGEPDEFTTALEDQVTRGVLGRFSSMGLTDSGASRNALFDAIMRNRLGIRGQRFNELATVSGFGERGANRFANIGNFATNQIAGARRNIGQANAFNTMNRANILGQFGDTLLNIPSSPNELASAARAVASGGFA